MTQYTRTINHLAHDALRDKELEKNIKRYAIIMGKPASHVIRMALAAFLEHQADILALAAMEILSEDIAMETKEWISLQENDPFQASQCFR